MAIGTVANSKVDDVTITPVLEGVVVEFTPALWTSLRNQEPEGVAGQDQFPVPEDGNVIHTPARR